LASLRPGGRDFERLCKWLLENVPEYERRLTKVWLWDEWPKDRDGGVWAIQAKHYHPAYSIKKTDLDSFLSASSPCGSTRH
jgi:predicted helicase